MEKKKVKRRVIGSVLTSKDNPKEFYIKIREDVVLKGGSSLRLESAQQQLESAEKAHAEGKLTADVMEKIRERIGNIPNWVRFEIVQLSS